MMNPDGEYIERVSDPKMEIDPINKYLEISNPAYYISEEQQPLTQPHIQQQTEPLDNNFRFGWGRISGERLQRFNKPLYFLISSAFAVFCEGFVVVGISHGAITSIERQFGYTSSEVAMFTLASEATIGVVSVFLGYFGNIHKPRCIALSLIVMAGESCNFKKLFFVRLTVHNISHRFSHSIFCPNFCAPESSE